MLVFLLFCFIVHAADLEKYPDEVEVIAKNPNQFRDSTPDAETMKSDSTNYKLKKIEKNIQNAMNEVKKIEQSSLLKIDENLPETDTSILKRHKHTSVKSGSAEPQDVDEVDFQNINNIDQYLGNLHKNFVDDLDLEDDFELIEEERSQLAQTKQIYADKIKLYRQKEKELELERMDLYRNGNNDMKKMRKRVKQRHDSETAKRLRRQNSSDSTGDNTSWFAMSGKTKISIIFVILSFVGGYVYGSKKLKALTYDKLPHISGNKGIELTENNTTYQTLMKPAE